MKKASKDFSLKAFDICYGRCERIRTFDPLHPMQVRYQAAPHTEKARYCNPLKAQFLRSRWPEAREFQTIRA
jgi:hypothetical protein